jgi:hypothetical protein
MNTKKTGSTTECSVLALFLLGDLGGAWRLGEKAFGIAFCGRNGGLSDDFRIETA